MAAPLTGGAFAAELASVVAAYRATVADASDDLALLLERMAAANPDIISIDQSVDIVDGIKRVGTGFAIQVGRRGRGRMGLHGPACACIGQTDQTRGQFPV